MTNSNLLSSVEHKLLLNFVLLICLVYFYNLFDKAIFQYNEDVKFSQEIKEARANDPKPSKISFGVYDNCSGAPLWHLFYVLQFFTTPLAYFLLRVQRIRRFIIAGISTLISFLSFSAWAYQTFVYSKFIEGDSKLYASFNQHILFDSTILEFVLFVLFALLLFLQISIFFRFVLEKFQAKISLK